MSFRDILKQLGGIPPQVHPDAGNLLLADPDNPGQRPLFTADSDARREAECAEYVRQYQNEQYRMGAARQRDVRKILARLQSRGSLLDVGTGRGETLTHAEHFGFGPVKGTEVVPALLVADRVVYAQAHALPFNDGQFDHVTCFDVLEHLLPEDVGPAIAELYRVARSTVTISAGTKPSVFGDRDLHISARSVEAWEDTFRANIPGLVLSPPGSAGGSPCWRFVKL